MDIGALKAKVAETFIVYRGQRLNFSFRPDMYTDEVHRQYGGWQVTREFENGNQILLQLLVNWDLTDGGIPVPLNESSIALVPVPVKLAVFKAIMDEVLSGKNNGSLSGSSMATNGSAQSSTSSFAS